jgi:hypothetical protein
MSVQAVSRYALKLACVYLAAWTVSYIIFVGIDFQHYFEYLSLAWTGPGEIPAFIQMTSIVLTLFSAACLVGWKIVVKRRRGGT